MPNVPSIVLNNSVEIPQLGFGVYQIEPDKVRSATERALNAGYRHIDTAAAYANEAGVGEAVRNSGIPRDEIFITTKLRNADQGYESTLRSFERSSHELGLEVIDLYLIHWPYPRHNLFVGSWKALEKLYADGAVRAIGVSNFLQPHLERILTEGDIIPAVNQIELHPTFQQTELTEYSVAHGIAVESYSPLGQGQDLSGTVVKEIAAAHGKSPAQVVLRWHLQRGFIVIPKSISAQRVQENIDVFDFSLSQDEVALINGLESGLRTSGDPATFDFPQI
ncbi:aldo/keto reductase [Cryobacterium sp. TMT4-10]|uniref:aldo/keto reductase n=1 Tax=Cryobacterium sp. TMT4-10 TaxID=1259256 RepID=UPI00106AF3DA|nr:aldo/keto reductase [Cryobacterium sp. TMT4-10]TFD12139.1 aldo/keto reductase [Cryobacterium sp. TMT4-10]